MPNAMSDNHKHCGPYSCGSASIYLFAGVSILGSLWHSNYHAGWRYDGMLCEADNTETGAMWECPLLLELTQTQPNAKPSAQTTGGIQSIHDAHTQLPTPTGKPASFRDTHNLGGQTDKAVESEPGNFHESFGRIEPQPVASTSGKAGAGVSLLSRQMNNLHVGSSQDSGPGNLAQQPSTQQQQQQPKQHTHFLCISPDAPTNPVLYWLGAFDHQNTKFILEGAKGPLKLDLGDILYAPNLMIDGKVSSLNSCACHLILSCS